MSGMWAALPALQVNALVPRRIPGRGVVVPRRVLAYRARITRTLAGQRATVERCGHNHLKRDAADTCGQRLAASLNRQAHDPGHVVWPSAYGLRTARGFMLAAVPEGLSPGALPLRGYCQPCGQPIHLRATGQAWQHTDTDATARAVGDLLAALLGDGALAYAAATAVLEGGSR